MTSSRVMRPVTTVSAMSAPSWDAGPPECAISMWLLLVMKVRRTSSRGASSLTCATLRPLQAMNLNLSWSNEFEFELELTSMLHNVSCVCDNPACPSQELAVQLRQTLRPKKVRLLHHGSSCSVQAEIVAQKKVKNR